MTYVLKIKKSNATGASITDIEKLLKTTYRSLDYLLGFCDGYLFDNYQLSTLEDFEGKFNHGMNQLQDIWYIKFVTVEEQEAEE